MRNATIGVIPRLALLIFLLFRPGLVQATEAIFVDPLGASLPASAKMSAQIEDDIPQFEAKLVVSTDPSPRVGVLFDLAAGWHLYWRNPGESGVAPRLDLDVTGHRVGDLQWPAPKTFREADGLFTTYGYENRVLLIAPIEPEANESASAQDLELVQLDGSVLICRTECVPISFTLSTPLDFELSEPKQARVDALFRDFLARVPDTALDFGLQAEAYWTSEASDSEQARGLDLRIWGCEPDGQTCQPVAANSHESLFIPMEENAFEFSEVSLVSATQRTGIATISMQATLVESNSDRLRGLVRLRDHEGQIRHVALDLPILEDTTKASALASSPLIPAFQIMLFALLGGLILNCMPCVLPILAIKVVAVASMAQKSPQQVRLNGLAYTGGVLASMALLSLAVTGLRSAGHFVGWGFQFQEPLFVAAISALLVAFAMNLFGVFHIELGQGRLASLGQESSGYSRSAFEGFIAVVLATPCTAPFLGTAVGFAFASSALLSASIFLAIGLGLASPFLAISFFPSLARLIPRPGAWMIKLRSALGFGLLATVVWLLWVIGQGAGADAVIAMAASLLCLSFFLWIFGQIQPLGNLWTARVSIAAIACISLASFNFIDFDPIDESVNASSEEDLSSATDSDWQIYSSQAVAKTLAKGQPAFVVFTADWCITCQLNEHAVLKRQAVQDAFRSRNVALFKADWTRKDDAIRERLAEFGRAGVPLYLVYSPEKPNQPQILSELLSQREVIAALPPDEQPPQG